MKPTGLPLLLALLALPAQAQAQAPRGRSSPCPDGTHECVPELRKASVEKLQADCMPQLEEVTRTFLKSPSTSGRSRASGSGCLAV
jgi:hypothetical protein